MLTTITALGAHPPVALIQAGGLGIWNPLVNLLKALLVSCGSLGLLVGCAIKATASTNDLKHAFSHKVIGASMAGLFVGLAAEDIYSMFDAWTG